MDVNSLAHTKMGMQVSYRFCTEISPSGNLQRHKSRCRTDTGNIMQKKRNRNYRSGMLQRSYTYAGTYSTEVFCVRNSRILKRKKFVNDI